jgi:hypothetical protein
MFIKNYKQKILFLSIVSFLLVLPSISYAGQYGYSGLWMGYGNQYFLKNGVRTAYINYRAIYVQRLNNQNKKYLMIIIDSQIKKVFYYKMQLHFTNKDIPFLLSVPYRKTNFELLVRSVKNPSFIILSLPGLMEQSVYENCDTIYHNFHNNN